MKHTCGLGIELKYLDLAVEEIVQGIQSSLKLLEEKQVEKLLKVIVDSNKILIVGQGRSGLVGRAFAMRLMHLGLSVYVVGETITPSIEMGDLLFAISGSGRTPK